MDTRELLWRIARPLGGIELTELQGLQDQLELSREDYEARLAAVEARKNALFADGLRRADRRGQEARAQQIATLESEANQLVGLLRIAHKQRLLLDRLVWLRENLQAMSRLRQEAPAAVPVDWLTLIAASNEEFDEESRLDTLNNGLARTIPLVSKRSGGEIYGADNAPRISDSSIRVAPVSIPVDPAPTASTYLVVRVLDGATIELANGWRVRYIGVDAPLMQNAFGRADAGAQEALDANLALVGHKQVRLETDKLDTDADGALWRYVYVGDVLVNAELMRRGLVLHANRFPNNRLAAELLAAGQEARRHKRGLWRPGPEHCVAAGPPGD